MHEPDLRPFSPRVVLSYTVTRTMDAAAVWLSPQAAGLNVPTPASTVDVYTCQELRDVILALGTAFTRLASPQTAPRFRVIARRPGDLTAHLLGMGCWQSKGGIYVSSGAPWTCCDRLGDPQHICPDNAPPPHLP